MKLKYYMRGLGIGMIVTAFILSVVLDKDTKTMSDDEILARAKELGMVESTVLSQMAGQNKNESDSKNNETISSETKDEQQTEIESEVADNESESVPETEPGESQSEAEESSGVAETEPEMETEPETEPGGGTQSGTEEEKLPEIITIMITPGESSETVCRSMEEAGLIESARELDRYLCDNGYDNRIAVGTYEIPTGSTAEEIAKIITKSR